jgi:hypothetical protein
MPFTVGPIHQLHRDCQEQHRLLAIVDELRAEHATAAGQLARGMPTLDRDGFSLARLTVDVAYERLVRAMDALRQHKLEHGC